MLKITNYTMEKKKKLQLNKETMAILNSSSMQQLVGGDDGDTTCPKGFERIADICVDILHGVVSLIVAPAGAMCVTINLSYNHCPTVKTDCDTCTCYTRWCIS